MSQYNNSQRAAALRYSADSRSAPVVVASGLGYAAQKIIDIAQENSVPIYQDDSLASLLTQLDAGSEIPPELYQAIVDIYVYFLNYHLDPQLEAKAEADAPASEESPAKTAEIERKSE